MLTRKCQAVSLLSAALLAAGAMAHEPVAPADPKAQSATVPLYDNLGNLTYPVTTASELAQRYFDQGLRLTYAFNHAEALRAFREAQRQDPNCALCYWGEAFVLGPNINAPMDAGASNPAVAAIAKAQALAHHAAAHEQALIAALAERYSDAAGAERAALDAAYADAMAEAHRRFPDDPEIAILYVDALMNLSPWDYWEADGETPKGRIGEAVAIAEKVLAAHPDHPGAIHLYIHLTEASNTPQRAEKHAERLASLMPGAGHLVHMASHVYIRVGRYHDSVELNKQAVAADEAYLAQTEAEGLYPYGYYPHNIHFVVVSAQMTGDEATAIEYAKRLEGKIPDEVAAQVGWIQAILQAPYFAHAQLSDPETILGLADPGDRFPLVKAMWHYARGVAYAQQDRVEEARGESARIAALGRSGDFSMLLAWAVPAPDLLSLARHVVEGRIAQAQGDAETAVREFRIAATIQDSLPYMEPPLWYYPVHQSLGAALLQAGKPAEAEAVFRESLERSPNNPWTLYGLMEAQKAQGDEPGAQQTEKQLIEARADRSDPIELGRL